MNELLLLIEYIQKYIVKIKKSLDYGLFFNWNFNKFFKTKNNIQLKKKKKFLRFIFLLKIIWKINIFYDKYVKKMLNKTI